MVFPRPQTSPRAINYQAATVVPAITHTLKFLSFYQYYYSFNECTHTTKFHIQELLYVLRSLTTSSDDIGTNLAVKVSYNMARRRVYA